MYGFADLQGRRLFGALVKCNGVGAKLALTILSGIEADDFVSCLRDGDILALVRLPGVGKKTAERLLVEMKDRLKDWQVDSITGESISTGRGSSNTIVAEAESALVALGYKPQEAAKAIAAANNDSMTSSEQLIRASLKNMVNR